MSHKATNWAVSQRGISPVAKVILWQLADRHNPDHGCFPDLETLARDSEASRATVIRVLSELEEKQLMVRVKRIHPVTQRQLPNRYILGFEQDFQPKDLSRVSGGDTASEEESRVSECNSAFSDEPDQSRVSNDDTDEASRVSNSSKAESHFEAETGITAETPIKGLTSKLTSKGTGKHAMRVDRGSVFDTIWKKFPLRPGSPKMDAWNLFEKIDEADLTAVEKGAERFSQWFREEAARKGEDFTEACRFAPHLLNWLKGQKWLDAESLPVSAKLSGDAMPSMDGTETVNKWAQHPLFEACEAVRGKPVPVGKSGSWTFPKDLVDEARRRLAQRQDTGPPA